MTSLASGAPGGHHPTSPPEHHGLRLCADDEDLVSVAAGVAQEALVAGDAVLVVLAAGRLPALERALRAREVDAAGARAEGRLTTVQTEGAIRALEASGGVGHPAASMTTALDAARAASRSGGVRATGDLSERVWLHAGPAACLEMEAEWSELVARHGLRLLCLCGVDAVGAPGPARALRDLCAAHGAVRPPAPGGAPAGRARGAGVLDASILDVEVEPERRRRAQEHRRRLARSERAARAEASLLHWLADRAHRAETPEQLCHATLAGVGAALGAARASVVLRADGRELRCGVGPTTDALLAAGPFRWPPGAATPEPQLLEDLRAVSGPPAAGALAAFPVLAGREVVGAFTAEHDEPHVFTSAEERIGQAFADQLGFKVERERAQRERERMLGILGHDLRSPLGAIASSTAVLDRLGIDARLASTSRRIRASVERMDRMISQLLEFARIGGGGIPVRREPCDLAAIAAAVLDELRAAHPDRALGLEVEGDATGAWDADRLAQVVQNLVANALQHGEGPVQVSIAGEGPRVLATVHNDGRPIDPALLPRLFDPFRRGGPGGGHHLGLGLYITREIVRALDGTLEVRSSAADGTTFSVRLPR